MNISGNDKFHKAQMVVSELLKFVDLAIADQLRADQLERGLLKQLLELGYELVEVALASSGDGDVGPTMERDGRELKRLAEKRSRRYVSVFGEHSFEQAVYAVRENQKIEGRPVDERWGLPDSEHSYVLQDWLNRFCIKEAFAEGCASLEQMLGLRIPVSTAERMNQQLAARAEDYRLAQPAPETAKQDELIVYANDCKGVPMRRPLGERVRDHGHRRGKGEKANKKQMACVGAAYTVDPFVRTADDILDEAFHEQSESQRPKPQNKRLWAEMTHAREGEPVNGKTRVFIQQALDLCERDPDGNRTVICLTDGEKALRQEQKEWLPRAIGILDIWHVIEYLWDASYCLHAEGSPAARQWVEDRLRSLLEGKVGYAIGYLRRVHNDLRARGSPPAKRRPLTRAITYFENNRQYMKYDEYLAAGYPIGSGVAEGACRHVVKDRMERTGMRWTVHGAQSLLHLRAMYLNGDWEDYLESYIEAEQTALYGRNAA